MMSDNADKTEKSFIEKQRSKFAACQQKLQILSFAKKEEYHKQELHKLIDELLALEYTLKLVNQEVAGDVLWKFSKVIPVQDEKLLVKFSILTLCLGSKQKLVLVNHLQELIEFIVSAIPLSCNQRIIPDLLRALSTLVYENCSELTKHHTRLLGDNGLLCQLVKLSDENVERGSIQCVENLCLHNGTNPYLADVHIETAMKIFLSCMRSINKSKMENVIQCKILTSALRGVQNTVVAKKTVPGDILGHLLAVLKHYVFYGIPGQRKEIPNSLYPTPLSQFDTSVEGQNSTLEQAGPEAGSKTDADTKSKKPRKKRGKGRKKKKVPTATLR